MLSGIKRSLKLERKIRNRGTRGKGKAENNNNTTSVYCTHPPPNAWPEGISIGREPAGRASKTSHLDSPLWNNRARPSLEAADNRLLASHGLRDYELGINFLSTRSLHGPGRWKPPDRSNENDAQIEAAVFSPRSPRRGKHANDREEGQKNERKEKELKEEGRTKKEKKATNSTPDNARIQYRTRHR